MDLPSNELPGHIDLPDVSELTMLELLSSRDPRLVAALAGLIELVDRTHETRAGWNSAIGVE